MGLAFGVALFVPAPLRSLSGDVRTLAMCLGVGYALCASYLLWREHRSRSSGPETLITALVVGFAPAVLFSFGARGALPNRGMLAELMWGGALATVTVILRGAPRARGVVLAIAAVVGLVLPFTSMTKPHMLPAIRHWRLNTSLYGLKVTEYRTLIPQSPSTGGAVAAFRGDFILATGVGRLFLLSRASGSQVLSARELAPPVPINWHDFQRTFGDQEDVTYFRTADLFVQDLGARARLFATHHYWKAEQKCFVVRVSMLEADSDKLLHASIDGASWKTIFESSPCFKLDTSAPLAHFGGIQIGGRLAMLGSSQLLVAIGDHEHDGVNARDTVSQDVTNSYGKTILIDLKDFSSQQYSMGHRNPQGLFIDGPHAIWLTEHGPQGGDELNLIERGGNYGWPRVSYGTEYGAHFWPGDPIPGSHDGYAEPFYSWVPSIGVSSLEVMHSPQFKLWEGDLLVSSLKDGAIYRARVRNAHVSMLERMPIGRRIRDLTTGAAGQLMIWTDRGALLEVEADNDVSGGETVFRTCSGCHVIGDGISNGIGPDLRKVVNRPVASNVGYRYSSAMRKLGGRWTRKRLDQFLTHPQEYVPGTKMQFLGIESDAQREQLIDFLASGANNNPPPEDKLGEAEQ